MYRAHRFSLWHWRSASPWRDWPPPLVPRVVPADRIHARHSWWIQRPHDPWNANSSSAILPDPHAPLALPEAELVRLGPLLQPHNSACEYPGLHTVSNLLYFRL